MKGKNHELQQDQLGFAVGYAFRATQDFITHLAQSVQIPYSVITERVAALLSGPESGQGLRLEGGMSSLPGEATGGDRTVEPLALAGGSPSQRTSLEPRRMSKAGRVAIARAQKLRWAKKKKKNGIYHKQPSALPKGEATRLAVKFMRTRQLTQTEAVSALAKKYPKLSHYAWNAALTNGTRYGYLHKAADGKLTINKAAKVA